MTRVEGYSGLFGKFGKGRLNIGIDIDDVLADFMTEFTTTCNKLHGKPELDAQPVDWEWSNFNLTREEKDTTWSALQGTPNFWTQLKKEPGANFDLMQRLDKEHELSFITARVPSAGDSVRHQTSQWLLNNFGIPFPNVFVTTNKGPLAAALKLDYFIDDRPKNVLEIRAAVPTCKVVLKDSCHNQAFVDPEIPRVKDFDTFAKSILEG